MRIFKLQSTQFHYSLSKCLAKNSRKLQKDLEQKISTFVQNLSTEKNFDECMNTKNEFKKFDNKIVDGVKIHNKCNWYQYGKI